MKKTNEALKRVFSLFLVLIILAGIFIGNVFVIHAETIEKSYDIAVVYDNSGSMFMPGDGSDGKAWSRAKYAMEIFASMLDYEKDLLHIFPMWEVFTDGSTPKSGGSHKAIEVKSKKDIDKIHKMYTMVDPKLGTPYAPVKEAYSYLKKSKKDEKWLIILTDGQFNMEDRTSGVVPVDQLKAEDRISGLASGKIKVQYVAFGEAELKDSLKPQPENNFFSRKTTDTSLKDDLVEICNSIFQRSVLPANRLSGSDLSIDLSMKKLIVFAQGKNVNVESLKNNDGKEIKVTMDSGQRKYSELGAKGFDHPAIDDTLAGRVVTFDKCPKGDYTLSCTGAEKIEMFYEPDVSIDVSFVNSDGEKVDKKEDFSAGKYTVTSKISDAVTGEDVTSHELMGNVDLKTYVKTPNDEKPVAYENGSTIDFKAGDTAEVEVIGRYLDKYTISSKDDSKWGWLTDLNPDQQSFEINATVLQSGSWYKLSEHDKWKPIKVDVTFDGKKLSDEQLKRISLNISSNKDLLYRIEPAAGESAMNIYIAQNSDGSYLEPNTGKYKLEISASYQDDFGGKIESEQKTAKFEIQNYSKLWRYALIFGILLIILFVLGVITFILHKIKVFPNGVDTENSTCIFGGKKAGGAVAQLVVTSKGLFKKTGNIRVGSTKGNMGISLLVEATHPLFRFPFKYQKSQRRRYKITGISASSMDQVIVNGSSYKKENYNEAKEFGGDQTMVEFSKLTGGVKKIVKATLVNKK